MVRTRLNIGCRYSTPVRERPLHPTRGHFTPEPSQTQAPVTPATEPERRAGGSLTTVHHQGGLQVGVASIPDYCLADRVVVESAGFHQVSILSGPAKALPIPATKSSLTAWSASVVSVHTNTHKC